MAVADRADWPTTGFCSQWGSDFGGSSPVIYDTRADTATDPSLINKAFKRWAGRDCAVSIKPLGFSADGKVVLNAGPSRAPAPEPGELEPNSCLEKARTWFYDIATEGLTQSPSGYVVTRSGEFENRAP